MTSEYYCGLAADMARASLAAGKYPFEICSNCESKVLELLTSVHLEDMLSANSEEVLTQPNAERLSLHRWLSQHRVECKHKALDTPGQPASGSRNESALRTFATGSDV